MIQLGMPAQSLYTGIIVSATVPRVALLRPSPLGPNESVHRDRASGVSKPVGMLLSTLRGG